MIELSVFDIIGPIMIGPSSSHTAGALRIARIAGKLVRGKIKQIEFTLYGSFAKTHIGHGTDRALVGGILGYQTDDYRIKDSLETASAEGIDCIFKTCTDETSFHPNTVGIKMTDDAGAVTEVLGSSIGGGDIEIFRINDAEVSISGKYNTIFVSQNDKPGVVSKLTNILEMANVNVAFMKVCREARGERAYSIIEIDGDINREVIDMLGKIKNVRFVEFIEI